MPRLSKSGQTEVKAIMESNNSLNIKTLRDLSIVASQVILDEVLSDIKFNQEITLAQLTKDGRLNLNYYELEKNSIFYEPNLLLNRGEVKEWLVKRYLVGKNVSEDSARNFVNKRLDMREDTCKYFCKGLQVVYTKVIENDKKLEPIQVTLTEFDHSQQLQDFGKQLNKYKKKIPLFYYLNNNYGYLPLKWLLLRCLNHKDNGNNCQTTFIKFNVVKTARLSNDIVLTNLKEQLIKSLNQQVFSDSPSKKMKKDIKLRKISKILARDILFKQNIVLVFDAEFNKDTIVKFWEALIQNLPTLTSTDHCLLLLVISTNPNDYNFPQVNIKQQFSRDDLLLWLNNDRVQRMLNLQDEQELIDSTDIIWQNSQNGQPQVLLEAIYEKFNCKWEEVKDQWINL